jgi:FKBP-type peptidyl-prolyl cis-trans isomerase SlyD
MSDNDRVGHGKVVYITYSVLDEDGQVRGQQDMPTGYVHGVGSGLFAQVEAALEGCQVGDKVEARVPPEDGFGPSEPSLIITEAVDNVPPPYRHIGAEAEFQNEQGEVVTFRVVSIEDGILTLDGNPPLAGRTAVVVASVVSIRAATAEEMQSGFPKEQGAPALH